MRSRNLVMDIGRYLDLLTSAPLPFAFYSSLALMYYALTMMDIWLLKQIVSYSNPALDLIFSFLKEVGGMPFWRRAPALTLLGFDAGLKTEDLPRESLMERFRPAILCAPISLELRIDG